jgi:Uma2 family endonuclease
MSVAVSRRLFTVKQYHEMARSGILSEDDRVELLAGEIVEMSPIGSRHAACVKRLTKILDSQIGDAAILGVQDPIHLGPRSEPQPDLALLKPRADFYAQAHPGPQDVLLIIEVAETSGESDRKLKLPLYAKASIPEVWIWELASKRVEVYRRPAGRKYLVIETFTQKQTLSPQTFPNVKVDLKEIFRMI